MNRRAGSSTGFVAELVPKCRVRKLLLLWSASATAAGLVMIAALPLLPQLEALFGLLWLWRGILRYRHQQLGMRRLERLRLRPGSLEGLSPGGESQPLELLSGSVVLSRIAWLRLRFPHGPGFGELLTMDARAKDDWRRFQLIWRQQGPVFGRPLGS